MISPTDLAEMRTMAEALPEGDAARRAIVMLLDEVDRRGDALRRIAERVARYSQAKHCVHAERVGELEHEAQRRNTALNERVADLTARHQEQLTAAVEQARAEEREAIASYLRAEARKSSDAADALPEGEEERHTYTGRWDAFRDAEVWVRARGSR